MLYLQHYGVRRALHSFPTRRSSDLVVAALRLIFGVFQSFLDRAFALLDFALKQLFYLIHFQVAVLVFGLANQIGYLKVEDRKSTRLNSSHVEISYAVFGLKKKKTPA